MTRQRKSRSPSVPPAGSAQGQEHGGAVRDYAGGSPTDGSETDGLSEEIAILRKRIRQWDQSLDALPQNQGEELWKSTSALAAACTRLANLLQAEQKLQVKAANTPDAMNQALAEALKELGL